MKIVIMGCGRVGARLATLFDREGHHVTILDLRAEAFTRLPSDFGGETLHGTGIDEDVLRLAGIEQADLFLAMTQGDNSNIMAAQIAKINFRVPRVITRIYDPDREETYHQMGVETLCPTILISNRVYEAVASGYDAHMEAIQPAPATPRKPAPPVADAYTNGHADDKHPAQDRHGNALTDVLRGRFLR